MLIYYFIYGIFILIGFLSLKQKNKKILYIYTIILILLFALRSERMGIDLHYNLKYGYLGSFDYLSKLSWKEILTNSYLNYEIGYRILNRLIGVFTHNRQVLLFICALISIFPIGYVITKESKMPMLSFIIYMGLPSFVLLFSGLRQGIALGLVFLSINYIKQKKLIKFLLLVLIASLFHKSALVFIVAFPIYWIKDTSIMRILSILVLIFMFLFRYYIFTFFNTTFNLELIPDNNNSINLLLALVTLYIICSLFNTYQFKKISGYLNIFYCSCVIQVFGGLFGLALRVGYYFMIILVLLLPDILSNLSMENRKYREILYFLFMIFFISFGLYNLYYTSWAQANPYFFYWQ